MSKITEEIKDLYNDHLFISRKFRRKPCKARKNFDGFEDDDRFRHYYFLARWFRKHSHINKKLFFEATLYFHRHEDFIPIEEYVKSTALTNYTQYCKIIDSLDLSNPKSIEFCVDSFKFIKDFCKEKGICPSKYLEYSDGDGHQPYFWTHIKGHKVCRYALFVYGDYYKKMERLYREPELWDMYLGAGEFTPFVFLKRFESSVKYKKLAKAIYKKITSVV